MPRQTEDINVSKGVRYQCDSCDRAEKRKYIVPEAGGNDASARIAGWRIGPDGKPVLCPECVGTDEDYWDRQTLFVAQMAGIDAGNTAWGEVA